MPFSRALLRAEYAKRKGRIGQGLVYTRRGERGKERKATERERRRGDFKLVFTAQEIVVSVFSDTLAAFSFEKVKKCLKNPR